MNCVYYLILLSVSIIVAILAPFIFLLIPHTLDNPNSFDKILKTITIMPEQLATYNGLPGSPGMYISILGKVYDVFGGEKHYGPGASYNFFVGRDGSKAFVTGNFDSIEDNNVLTLQPSEIQSLVKWAQFYENRYRFVGLLIGDFYDENGLETKYLQHIHEQVSIAEQMEKISKELEIEYPPCNVEWIADAGTRVWCTRESGGISREWSGVPRKYFQDGVSDWRCACVGNLSGASNPSSVTEFEGCDREASSCVYNAEA